VGAHDVGAQNVGVEGGGGLGPMYVSFFVINEGLHVMPAHFRTLSRQNLLGPPQMEVNHGLFLSRNLDWMMERVRCSPC
jgi:hypothetical protein